MTFEDLRVFATVAGERSFSRAARKLHRTQPAVSQAVRRLEEAVGQRLIDRASRDGTLTDAGEVLLDYGAAGAAPADPDQDGPFASQGWKAGQPGFLTRSILMSVPWIVNQRAAEGASFAPSASSPSTRRSYCSGSSVPA